MKVAQLYNAIRTVGISADTLAAAAGMPSTTARNHLAGRQRSDRLESVRTARQRLIASARRLGVDVPADPWVLVDRLNFVAGDRTARPPCAAPPSPAAVAPPPDLETELTPFKITLSADTLKHWQLADDPFAELLPEHLWRSGHTQWVEKRLTAAIERRHIVALVGDAGRGKSTILRSLHYRLTSKYGERVVWMAPGNLDRGTINEGGLAAAMLRDLGWADGAALSTSSERRGDELRRELQRRVKDGQFPVLGIDEAHDLSPEGLIAIKRIWDSFTFNRALSVLLSGQRPLVEALRRNPALREVAGRTEVIELPDLSADDVTEYLGFRLELVGRQVSDVFEAPAIESLVQRGARGPLWVDALAARAMTAAAERGAPRITAAIASRC